MVEGVRSKGRHPEPRAVGRIPARQPGTVRASLSGVAEVNLPPSPGGVTEKVSAARSVELPASQAPPPGYSGRDVQERSGGPPAEPEVRGPERRGSCRHPGSTEAA